MVFTFTAISKTKEKDTNIICFAAQNKWICAPEDQQDIANEKATQLIKKQRSESIDSDVVIKSISLPKFNSNIDTSSSHTSNPTPKVSVALKPKEKASTAPAVQSTVTPINQMENPYAKLWSHQLIGLSTARRAIKFVKDNNLDESEVLIIQSSRLEKDWWIVLYGLYQNKQTGLNNETNLPTTSDKPWLRPLRNLRVKGFIEKY